MKRTKLPQQLQQLLNRVPYVTIATVSASGQPWNSPVVGRFDAAMNLYWVSWRRSQHSDNIRLNPRIFVVVYDTAVPEGSGEGLYLQMQAAALTDSASIAEAAKVYDTSFFREPAKHAQFMGLCPQRLYRAVPQRLWYNVDSVSKEHFIDTRCEIVLPSE